MYNHIKPSNGNAQGAIPVKIERPALRFTTYNEEGKPLKMKADEVLNVMSQYFVKMPIQNYYLWIKDDGSIDFSKAYSESKMIVKMDGLGIKRQLAKDILACEDIKEVSPLSLIYEGLNESEWDGVDRIRKVVKDLNLEGSFLENYKLIRRWFLNTYTLAFNYIDPKISWQPEPRVVFILHSNQRQWGKTAILGMLCLEGALRKLLPELHSEVYTLLRGEIPKDDREMNAYLMNSLAINIDDIQNLLNSSNGDNRAKLRSLTTQKEISGRKMWSESTRNSIRRAGLCGSTNNKTVLRDKDENRYMVFTLKNKVCFDTVNEDDFQLQFWTQIRKEALEEKRDCNFTNYETDLIITRAKSYLYKTELEQYIEDHFIYDFDAREYTSGTLKESLKNDMSCPDFSDHTLRKAVELLIPADGEYSRKADSKRWLCIKDNISDTRDNFVKGGDGLPF
jgi:hypothetical protein